MEIFGLTTVFTNYHRLDYWRRYVPDCFIVCNDYENQVKKVVEYQQHLKDINRLSIHNVIIDTKCYSYQWGQIPPDLMVNIYHISEVKSVAIPTSAIAYNNQLVSIENQFEAMTIDGVEDMEIDDGKNLSVANSWSTGC